MDITFVCGQPLTLTLGAVTGTGGFLLTVLAFLAFFSYAISHRCNYSGGTAASSEELPTWSKALASTSAPRCLLLPPGPNSAGADSNKKACNIQAMLGDSILKTYVLRAMGVTAWRDSRDPTETDLRQGDITKRVNQAVSNRALADAAAIILLVPGVDLCESLSLKTTKIK